MFPSAREFVNIRIAFPRIQQYLEAAMNNLTRNTDSMQKATGQNSSFFQFELLKNIDQPIPVILETHILCTLTFVVIMLT